MGRQMNLVVVLGLSVLATSCKPQVDPQKSAQEAAEQFYKLETQGRWLRPDHWDELQGFLTDVGPWSRPLSVSVLRNYRVVDCEMGHRCGENQIEVDFFEWGSIDYFLHFARVRGPRGETAAAGEPVEQRTYETLYLSDRFLKRSPSGQEEEKKGALGWRISLFTAMSVDVNTALRWVTEMREKSDDVMIKYNAEKTITILKSLSAGGPLPAQSARTAKESASEFAKRYLRLQSGLLPEQSNQLVGFFVETPKPQWKAIYIVDVVGTGVDTNDDSAEVQVSTNSLGKLDESLRLWDYPSGRLPPGNFGASACYGDDRFVFSLLLSDKHWQIAADGTVKELDGPLAWRIEDTSFVPLITLDTAIRYVKQVETSTSNPVVRKNASRTLSILNYYKQSKPLPAELSSDASNGCG